MATFITSKAVGEGISINVNTSTGFWKYNHDGVDSSLVYSGEQTISVTNANGEFVIISCDSDGIVSGDITFLALPNNQLTSLDFTGLSSLTILNLNNNQLTSFDGTGLTSLTTLYLYYNQLTSFDGTGLSSLTNLNLQSNILTSFNGTGLTSLDYLNLQENQLTSFDGTGLTSLTTLNLINNQLTSFDGTGLSGLQELDFTNNLFTSFDPTGLTSLTVLNLEGNPLTPSSNNQILNQLNQNGLSDGYFESNNGRTSESNDDYDNLLNNLGWVFSGLYLASTPPTTFITSKAVGQTITIYVTTSTGFWRYNHGGGDSSVFANTGGRRGTNIPITNSNGEFAIISCDSGGNVSGDITNLKLESNQITSFYPTGLSGLTQLILSDNPLTSFDGTGLSGLTYLSLTGPKHGGVGSLTSVSNLSTILTYLNLSNNQLTSFDVTGLVSLTELYLSVNPLTPSVNNQILNQFNQNGLSDGYFSSFNGRTLASNVDYDNLISLGWTFEGLDVVIPPTFITSKAVGETMNIYVKTSTGFCKYNHDGSDSSVNVHGWINNLPVTNVNGEFVIISCDSDGNVSGDITHLHLYSNQLISFDGTGLSSLNGLNLSDNQLTSFDGTGLSSLTGLELGFNQLTSFDATDLSNLNALGLEGNPLTSSSNNQILQQLNQNGLSNGEFYSSNGRTSASNTDYDNLLNNLGWYFEGLDLITTTQPTFITSKAFDETITISVQTSTGFWKYNHDGIYSEDVFDQNNGTQTIPVRNINGEFTIISCDESGNVSGDITQLNLYNNQLTSFDGTGLGSLTELNLYNNLLTSFDGTDLSSLTSLHLGNNQLTSFDVTGLSSLADLSLGDNQLTSFDGTGLSGLTYLYLIGNQLTSSSNNQILNQLNQNGLSGGQFYSSNGRTSASNTDYDNLVSLGWSFDGLDLIIPPTFITSKAVGETMDINVQTSTGFWKYNHDGSDSSVFGGGEQTISVTNINGEFTIISCDESGNVSGDVTYLVLINNLLTSFDGTSLTSLTQLYLNNNQLTSFDGTGLSSLLQLYLESNQLTSFDGTGLVSLTQLYLESNQLTSFDGTGLVSLNDLILPGNLLTSLDVSPLVNLSDLTLFQETKEGIVLTNPITPSSNNQILQQLNQNGLSGGEFLTSNGRTSASNTDYDNLLNNLGWYFEGLDLITVGNRRCRYRTH